MKTSGRAIELMMASGEIKVRLGSEATMTFETRSDTHIMYPGRGFVASIHQLCYRIHPPSSLHFI